MLRPRDIGARIVRARAHRLHDAAISLTATVPTHD
jgi:hypothetical protein